MKARTMRCHICSAEKTTRDQQAFCSGTDEAPHTKTRMSPTTVRSMTDRVLGAHAIQTQRLGTAKF